MITIQLFSRCWGNISTPQLNARCSTESLFIEVTDRRSDRPKHIEVQTKQFQRNSTMTDLNDDEILQVWDMFERGNAATAPGTFFTKPENLSEGGYKRLVTRQGFLSLADQATQPAVHRAIEVHLDEFEPDMRQKLENEIQKRWEQSKPILPESITNKAPAYSAMDNLIRKAEATRDVVREHKIRLPQYRQYADSMGQSGSLGLDGRSRTSAARTPASGERSKLEGAPIEGPAPMSGSGAAQVTPDSKLLEYLIEKKRAQRLVGGRPAQRQPGASHPRFGIQ